MCIHNIRILHLYSPQRRGIASRIFKTSSGYLKMSETIPQIPSCTKNCRHDPLYTHSITDTTDLRGILKLPRQSRRFHPIHMIANTPHCTNTPLRTQPIFGEL